MIFEALSATPPPSSAKEALEQLTDVMNSVEDQFTDIPYNPTTKGSDGRLYPPQEDNARTVSDHPHVTRYRSLKHNTFIGANGAVEIRTTRPEEVVFSKAGIDGKGVWEH